MQRHVLNDMGCKRTLPVSLLLFISRLHLIRLVLFILFLSVALRNESTGQSREMRGTVASIAKRNLNAVEKLDGEGGFTVWGKALPLPGA